MEIWVKTSQISKNKAAARFLANYLYFVQAGPSFCTLSQTESRLVKLICDRDTYQRLPATAYWARSPALSSCSPLKKVQDYAMTAKDNEEKEDCQTNGEASGEGCQSYHSG